MRFSIIFLLAIWGLLTGNVNAFAQPVVQYTGLLVEFKGLPSENLPTRDELHQRLQVELLYRSKNLAIDEVSPKNLHKLNRQGLRELCKLYAQSNLVWACEVKRFYGPPKNEFQENDHANLVDCRSPPNDVGQLKSLSRDILSAVGRTNKCELVDKSGPSQLGGLSPFWAQEYIGADLARSVVDAEPNSTQVSVAQLDGGFSQAHIKGAVDKSVDWASPDLSARNPEHGTKVCNLLNAPPPVGVAAKAVLGPLCSIYPPKGSYLKAADQVSDKKPKLVNLEEQILCLLSGCWSEELPVGPTKKILSQMASNSIVVAASGNHYPRGSRGNPSEGLNLLLVGSMNPVGWVSSFSDESRAVTVLAPSDNFLLSYGVTPGLSQFSGTSGATPLVTGALSNVMSIIPDLTFSEAKILLQKTAMPTATSKQVPQKNGAGMVNALKLVEVAKRLKRRGWPNNRQQLISDETVFNFSSDANQNLTEAKRLLASSDCKEQMSGFKLARRAALLGNSSEAFGVVAQVYDRQNLPINAQFYKNFDLNTARSGIAAALTRSPPYNSQPYSADSAKRMSDILSGK